MLSYRNRHSRITQHHEGVLIRRLLYAVIILVILIIGFMLWGVQTLVSISEVAGSVMRPDVPLQKRSEPIFPPRFEPLPSATNSAQVTITGAGRSGLEMQLFRDGEDVPIKKTIIGNDGLFSFEGIILRDGKNIFRAKQVKDTGESSQFSDPFIITLDKQPPKVELSEPAENTRRQGADQKELKILGKTEDGVTVTINDRWVAVGSEGTFATSVTLIEGEHTIILVASDVAGNVTKITRTVRWAP